MNDRDCWTMTILDPENRCGGARGAEYEWFTPRSYSSDFTGREREILVLLAKGRTRKRIGEQLNISLKAMEFHKANITRKLGVHSTSDLVKFALLHGITTLPLRA
jgi:DNA-binding NarL/FixJ family response regulator